MKKITSLVASLMLTAGALVGVGVVASQPGTPVVTEAAVYELINPGQCRYYSNGTFCNYTKLPKWIRVG